MNSISKLSNKLELELKEFKLSKNDNDLNMINYLDNFKNDDDLEIVLDFDDFLHSLNNITPSLSDKDILYYESIRNKFN
jgi:hypothetical protein